MNRVRENENNNQIFYLPLGHELEVTVFDERNMVVCQFDCSVLHSYPETIIVRTEDVEEADILLYEYQEYDLKFLNPDDSIKKLELEFPTIDPLRLVLYDTELVPSPLEYQPGGYAWDIYKELEALGRQPSLDEFCIKLKQDNFGFLSKISYVPKVYYLDDPTALCDCLGDNNEHVVGQHDDCSEIVKTVRKLEYNPL